MQHKQHVTATLRVAVFASAFRGKRMVLTATQDAERLVMIAEPARNMPIPLRDRHLQQALDKLPAWQPMLETLARERAQ